VKPSEEDDKKNLILYRSKHNFVIMNIYPYNNGHIMIVPYKHVATMQDLNDDELFDMIKTLRLSEKVIKKVYNPDGINVGMNLGKAAGAGIDEHLHIHVVPRWNGDVNFMTVIGGYRVIPESFETTYFKLKEAFDNTDSEK
jgi:ATP adenylyltransferase